MKTLTSKFVVILLAIALSLSSFGNVLCYGHDGHVTMEAFFHNHCQHDHHHDDAPQHDSASYSSIHCSPCDDILLTRDMNSNRIQPLSLIVSVLTISLIDTTTNVVSNNMPTQTASFTFHTPLKSIILLT